MTFLNFAAFWAAIALPLVVFAYFERRKARVRVASTLRFWDDAIGRNRSTVRGFRARNIVSMLLALAVAAALLFAAALPARARDDRRSPLVVVFDNSLSMNAIDNAGESRFQVAKRFLRKLVANKDREREILILETADAAKARVGFSDNVEALRRAVDSIESTDAPSAIFDALRLAQSFQALRKNARILLITDGACERFDELLDSVNNDPTASVMRVGERRGNVAILAFEPRRSPDGNASFQTFARVANYSDVPVEFDLETTLDGELLDVAPFELEPNEEARRTLVAESTDGGALRAQIVFRDPERVQNALERDDVADATLPDFPSLVVKLCGRQDRFLEAALRAQPNARVERVDVVPDVLENNEMLVLVAETPEFIPEGNVVILNPDASCSLFQLGDEISDAFVDEIDERSPVMRDLTFANFPSRGARTLAPNPNLNVKILAAAPEAPVLLEFDRSSPEKRSICRVLNFSTEKSPVAFQTLFPLLVANLVGDARGETDVDDARRPPRLKEETDLRANDKLFERIEFDRDVFYPGVSISAVLAAFAIALAVAEYWLYCRRRVE